MPKFHITKGGDAKACTAEKRACPLGAHYDSAEEAAMAKYETPSQTSWQQGEIQVRPLEEGLIQDPLQATLPPGRYFLGDPCYTAGKDDTAWQQWVEVAFAGGKDSKLIGGSYNGLPVVGCGTEYGDGTYIGSDGNNYSVDAGMVGLVPEAVIEGMGLSEDDLAGSGSWIESDQPIELSYEPSDGTIFAGPVAIHTGDRKCENCGQACADDDELCDDCRWDEEEEYEEQSEDDENW